MTERFLSKLDFIRQSPEPDIATILLVVPNALNDFAAFKYSDPLNYLELPQPALNVEFNAADLLLAARNAIKVNAFCFKE